MKAKVLFIATVAALFAFAIPVLAQADGRNNPVVTESGSSIFIKPITPTQALASAEGPNVVYVQPGEAASGPSGTTFVEVAPGLTLRQAVGLDPIPAATMAAMQARAAKAAIGAAGPDVLRGPASR